MPFENATRELYGGAITVQLPADVVDASDLREIPDHQEVFLSNKTLTSIIFEINEYQQPSAITSEDPNNTASTDEAAASYHLNDVIDDTDHISDTGIQTTPTKLSQLSVSKFPAYQSTATIVSPELDRSKKTTLPLAWQTNPAQKEQLVGTIQLLVRMENYDTDLCVRINVPLKEFGDSQSQAAQNEVTVAMEVMKNIAESIDIKDFSLFGAGE